MQAHQLLLLLLLLLLAVARVCQQARRTCSSQEQQEGETLLLNCGMAAMCVLSETAEVLTCCRGRHSPPQVDHCQRPWLPAQKQML
jgi:hypothetical protein